MKKLSKLLAFALCCCLLLAGCGGGTVSIFSRPTVERVAGQKKDWPDVSSFICYYGGFDDVQKNFDVSIMHSTALFSDADAAAKVKALSDAGTYSIAYLTVGEDDALNVGDGLGEGGYASYYIYENGFPKRNNNWASYFVDAGNPVWQAKILAKAEKILSYGVDGLFLDTVDTVDVAPESLGGMVSLVKLLDETFPEAKLVVNRGFTVLPYLSEYIDGMMFESFNTTWNFEDNRAADLSPEDNEYNENVACNVINRVRRYDYFPVFALDYVNYSEFAFMPQAHYDRSWQYDFIPYCTYDVLLATACDPGVKPQSKRGELALSKFGESGLGTLNGDTSAANFAYTGNGATVRTDSTYGGYGTKALNDGWFATAENHNQKNWAQEAWASMRNGNADHWIEFTFPQERSVSTVKVYWANDNDSFKSARECIVEAWVGGEWVQVGKKTNEPETPDGDYLTNVMLYEITFEAVTTEKIRVVQPKGKGCADKWNEDVDVNIMWVSEVEIFA